MRESLNLKTHFPLQVRFYQVGAPEGGARDRSHNSSRMSLHKACTVCDGSLCQTTSGDFFPGLGPELEAAAFPITDICCSDVKMRDIFSSLSARYSLLKRANFGVQSCPYGPSFGLSLKQRLHTLLQMPSGSGSAVFGCKRMRNCT